MNQLLTLREVLTHHAIPFNHHLCLPGDAVWTAETRCAIVADDELDDPEQHPLAVAQKVTCTIGTNEVRDIVINAREQLPHADVNELLKAFLYYCDHDAFIDFENDV